MTAQEKHIAQLRICLAQINTTAGDIRGNQKRILSAVEQAHQDHADLIVFPELTLSGYGCGDWLLHDYFVGDCLHALNEIVPKCTDLVAVIGLPRTAPVGEDGQPRCYNSAAVVHNGELLGFYDKQELPNYLIFDETRHFVPGSGDGVFQITDQGKDISLGVSICEDLWHQAQAVKNQAQHGAELLINLGASPYALGKPERRHQQFAETARDLNKPLVYVNAIGGQDDLLFDGHSGLINGDSSEQLPGFQEAIETHTLNQMADRNVDKNPLSDLYAALVLSIRDYCRKNGFREVVLGLSGGIDSALVATLAADALGPEKVHALLLPSKYSSDHSVDDARQLAKNLGIQYDIVPIKAVHGVLEEQLSDHFNDYHRGLTDENLQARIRGLMLMAFSNNQNKLVLATSNKSESAVGYSTLYGDMVGGFAPINDVYKTQVFALCQFRNEKQPVIPENIITKPPSAELRPDQKDSDSLPDYDILDAILNAYIEQRQSPQSIAKVLELEQSVVMDVIQKVNRSEYKRYQAAIGPAVSGMKLGTDRRMPMTFRYNHE
ncbi:NAD+ synthase [Marinicella pacifica]|uniref:Glutamine-dependent NAD(+) synthetase n=1 Tax=Marinicella pacifica TaxID=1171543 RepID=A0A917CT60_9GAMM|nr:NAD+ synthase [Marinicella pacifica]GGF96324.1 NAD+ synthase [Marinicella pacifica]